MQVLVLLDKINNLVQTKKQLKHADYSNVITLSKLLIVTSLCLILLPRLELREGHLIYGNRKLSMAIYTSGAHHHLTP